MEISWGNERYEFRPWRPEMGRVFTSPFSFDTETGRIDESRPWFTPPFVLGAAFDGLRGYFVTKERLAQFVDLHGDFLMVMHNASFDLAVIHPLCRTNCDVYELVEKRTVADTMLLHQLLTLASDGRPSMGHGQATLETCSKKYLGRELPKDEKDRDGDLVRLSYAKWLSRPFTEMYPEYLDYLAKDVIATRFVFDELYRRIRCLLADGWNAFGYVDWPWLERCVQRWGWLTHHIQLQASIVLREITAVGLHVDTDRSDRLRSALESLSRELRAELRSWSYAPGTDGNQKALQEILRDLERRQPDLMLPRTATGKISTKAEDLVELAATVPFVQKFLEFRGIEKLQKTYLGKMAKSVLHPAFSTLVSSGRTSSFGDINAQNLPRDDRIRSCFIPSAGHVFVDADYKAVEMATLAQTVTGQFRHSSNLAVSLNNGDDPHRVVAARLLEKRPDEVTKDERQKAKAINFGKPGGMGAATLLAYARTSYGVELSEEDAERWSESWFDAFPEMRDYLADDLNVPQELATKLGVTQDALNRHTGRRFDLCVEDSPAQTAMLGCMLLKIMGHPEPKNSTGRAYEDETIDYFWTVLERALPSLPEEAHRLILERRPSRELSRLVRSVVDRRGVFTFTGRLRGNARYNVRRNTPFQGLAADGAKIALWKLWRAGYRIANFIHDEVLVEVPENEDLDAHANRIREIMIESMREVVPDVLIDVELVATRRWSKAAEELRDAAGKLLVWDELTVATDGV